MGTASGTFILVVMYIIYRPGLLYLLFGFLLVILFCWGESVIGTTIGAFFPEFKPAYRKRSNITFTGGLLNLILFVVYLAISGGIILGGLYIVNLGWHIGFSMLLILVVMIIINILLYNILINICTYRINNLEWIY